MLEPVEELVDESTGEERLPESPAPFESLRSEERSDECEVVSNALSWST